MPSYKGGYYRRNRDVIEYWFHENRYADGAQPDGTVLLVPNPKVAVDMAKYMVRTIQRTQA